jgi:hypothetical protein
MLFNNDVRQTEIHADELSVRKPSACEVQIAAEKMMRWDV